MEPEMRSVFYHKPESVQELFSGDLVYWYKTCRNICRDEKYLTGVQTGKKIERNSEVETI